MRTSIVLFVLINIVPQLVVSSNNKIQRLSTHVLPMRYTIRINLLLGPRFVFNGDVLLEVNVTRPVENITIHFENLKLREAVFVGPNHPLTQTVTKDSLLSDVNKLFQSVKESGRTGNVTEESDHLIINDDNELFEQGVYLFYFNYFGRIGSVFRHGFYRDFTDENPTKWIASTVFETSKARTAFPCFDEPAFKSRFRVILSRPEEYVALSNMPSARVEPVINREGWFWEYFHETPPMSTFLVAFFIGNYVSLESEGGIKFWGAPEYDPPSEWLLEKGDIVFEKLQKILGPNPLPKQDVIAIPHFVIAKAVENWGLLSFKKELIVGNVTGYKRHDQLNIFAHELAHNWFGNLVSPTCWNDVWFSEGFATFYSTVVVNRAIPDWDSVTWDTVEHLVITWLYDSTLNPVPLVEPFRTKYSNFELIVYSKGYFVIRMVNLTIGNEVFDKAISQYLKNNQFGLFSAESLWNTIENTAVEEKNLSLPIPLHKIMKRWIELPGMPFIKVNRENNGTIIISQERYIKSSDRFSNGTNDRGNGDDEDEDYGEQTEKLEKTDLTPHEWWIPITVITGQNDSYLNNDSDLITPQYWLQPGQKLIINDPNPDHSSWILINPYSPVPCHIAYDEWNYDLLKTEDFHKIPTLTQVQILGDVSTLALDSLMNFTQALEITSKILNGKENYVFWRIGIPHLLRIYRILYGSEARTIFKEFIQKLTSSKYRQLRLANTENESVESELLRPLIAKTSCLVQSKDCINDAVALFNKWSRNQKLDSENKVTEEIKPIVYCTISEYGGVKGWSLLWSKLKLAKDHTERRYLIEGMACSKNTQQLNRFLMASINMTSSLQLKDEKERKSVLHSIVKNPVAVDVVLDFINDHKDEIKKAYSRSGRKYNWRKVSDNITPLIRNEEQLSKRFLMTSGSKNIRLQSNYMINSAKWAMQWRLNNTKIFKEEWLL